jgi:hypothetical protein
MDARTFAPLRTVIVASDGHATLADRHGLSTQWQAWMRQANTRCIGIATPSAGALAQICNSVTPLKQLMS